MTLEALLNPAGLVQSLDKKLLQQYNALALKSDFAHQTKDFIAIGLNFFYTYSAGVFSKGFLGDYADPLWILTAVPDLWYGVCKLWGHDIPQPASSNKLPARLFVKVFDKVTDFSRSYNRLLRPFVFLLGTAAVGKFLLDTANSIATGQPIQEQSLNTLGYGVGLLSLSSSMYLKDAG